MTGYIESIDTGTDGRQRITLMLTSELDFDINMQKPYVVSPLRRKRSTDANALLWALCSEIGNALTPPVTKEEVYRTAIRGNGVFMAAAIKVEAVEASMRRWSMNGVGWFAEDLGPSRERIGYNTVLFYFGSSTYDSKEMSVLIESLIEDARQMELPIRQLMNDWDEIKRRIHNG